MYKEVHDFTSVAIDADIENIRYHHARCGLLEEMGDTRAALRGLRRLMASKRKGLDA